MKHRGGGPRFRTLRDIFTDFFLSFLGKEAGSIISAFLRDAQPPLSGVDLGDFSCSKDRYGCTGSWPVRSTGHRFLEELRIGVMV